MKVVLALAVLIAVAAAVVVKSEARWPDRNNNGIDDRLEKSYRGEWLLEM